MRFASTCAVACILLWAVIARPDDGGNAASSQGLSDAGTSALDHALPALPKHSEVGASPGGPRRFNPVRGGWARYLADSEVGPQVMVVRVGDSAIIDGNAGRWLRTELEIPEAGRLAMETFVVGPILETRAVRNVRFDGPWPEIKKLRSKVDLPAKIPDLPRAVLTRKSKQEIGGRTIVVEEYELEDRSYVAWSPDVPGTGVVRLAGAQQMMLVAFGVGGDPWAGAAQDLAGPLRSAVKK